MYIIIYYQVYNRIVASITNVHACTKRLLIYMMPKSRYICCLYVYVYTPVFRYIITNSARCRALYLNMYHVNRTFAQKF